MTASQVDDEHDLGNKSSRQKSLSSYNRRPIYSDEIDELRSEPFREYDVFLSHSYSDKEHIEELANRIIDLGYRVYVDWIDDSKLDRKAVTSYNIETLRNRLRSCTCLIFAVSKKDSFFRMDALGVRIFRWSERRTDWNLLAGSEKVPGFVGQEYLSIYPLLDEYNLPVFLERNASRSAAIDNTRAIADWLSRITIQTLENPFSVMFGYCHWWVAVWHHVLHNASQGSEICSPSELLLWELRRTLSEVRRTAGDPLYESPPHFKDLIYRHYYSPANIPDSRSSIRPCEGMSGVFMWD